MSLLPQGPWAPRKIANPDHFLDESPLQNLGSIGGVAIEIWTMDEGYLFDNVLIANDASDAEEKRTSLWAPKKEAEVRSSHMPKSTARKAKLHATILRQACRVPMQALQLY